MAKQKSDLTPSTLSNQKNEQLLSQKDFEKVIKGLKQENEDLKVSLKINKESMQSLIQEQAKKEKEL